VFLWRETGLVRLAMDIHSCVFIKGHTHVIQINEEQGHVYTHAHDVAYFPLPLLGASACTCS
jgi:hypothetical protein